MSNNPFWSTKPDLTRLPEYLRQTLTQPIPMRVAEVRAQTIIFPLTSEYGLNHPNGRLRAMVHIPQGDKVNVIDGIMVETYDFTGHKPLTASILKREAIPEFLKGYITAYIRDKQSWSEFDKLVEELKCTSPIPVQ
jgi:hypothetical protein